MSNEHHPRFLGIVSGTNGDGPHGLARYGDEWRRVDPVDGVLTPPVDADDFVMVAGGGAGDGGVGLHRINQAQGGGIQPSRPDDDSITVRLSPGSYSLDGGETWFDEGTKP